jgi:LuxR family quorum-sensing transcriptional regulator LasR
MWSPLVPDDSFIPSLLTLCETLGTLDNGATAQHLADIVGRAGFGGYCVSVIPDDPVISDIAVLLYGGNLTLVVESYLSQGMIAHDPVIRAAARQKRPVLWSDHLDGRAGQGAASLRTVLSERGILDGVIIPAGLVQGRCRAFLAISALSGQPSAEFASAYAGAEKLLRLLARLVGPHATAARRIEAQLSKSEILVLAAMSDGLRPREIAAKFGKSEHTIRNQIVSAQQRLGARTKEQALVTAIRLGILTP